MYVLRPGEKHYLRTHIYNMARVLTEMAVMIKARGGKVKALIPTMIHFRGLNEEIRTIERDIGITETFLNNKGRLNLTDPLVVTGIAPLKEKLKKLREISPEPLTVSHLSYITFILDGVYYYFQISENIFMPDYYQKTVVINEKYSGDACLDELPKTWQRDCLFDYLCKSGEVAECAGNLLDLLIKTPFSVIRHDSKTVAVPNTYNNGTHMETVYTKRIAKVDF